MIPWVLERGRKLYELEFFVPDEPRPKERAEPFVKRLQVKGKTVHVGDVKDPEENGLNAEVIRQRFIQAVMQRNDIKIPHLGPVKLRWYGLFLPTTRYYEGMGKTTKPDLDNMIKLTKDALEKFAYKNDGQVNGEHVEKGYWQTAGTVVVVEFWEDPPKPLKTRGRPPGRNQNGTETNL